MVKAYALLLVLLLPHYTSAQTGVSINAGPDTTLPCGESCFNYKLKVPLLKSTDDYRVDAVAYAPLPFVTAVPGLTLPCPEQDDKFFDISNFGFDFCFYGETFQSLVIGTNGVLSFDLSNALNCNNWDIDPADGAGPIPFTGNSVPCTFPCDFPSDVLYPRLSIMGVYNDLAIDEFSIDKKVEFRVVGTAPFRRAIISFYKIPVYECTTTSSTHQAVIYETTNIIDVFVKDRPPCTKWNAGNAILGIQNRARDKGLAPPGRNLGAWGSANMNEGWRFTPDGNTSSLDHVELLLNNTIVATGVAGTVNNDSVVIDFSNVCLPANSHQYTVRAYYKTCTNSSPVLFAEDNFTATKIAAPVVSAAVADAACKANGTINITSPLGPQYKYSADGILFQYVPSFDLLPGTYAITAADTVTGCVVSKSFTINQLSTLTAQAQAADAFCSNSATGSITVNATGGTAPYSYSINNGTKVSTNLFSLLTPGIYFIVVEDKNGCTFSLSSEVKAKPDVTATAAVTNTSCNTINDGEIIITASAGTTPYQYSNDGGITYQASNTFSNIKAGTYNLTVKDAGNCIYNFTAGIINGPGVTVDGIVNNTSCSSIPNGKVTINTVTGKAPFTYSFSNGSFQNNNQFANLFAGDYTIVIKDNAGCTQTIVARVESEPQLVLDSVIAKNISCNGLNDGVIKIYPRLGVQPYSFALDAGIYQSSNTFTTIGPSQNITVHVKDNSGCIKDTVIIITQPPVLGIGSVVENASCSGNADGKITAVANGGIMPYQYTIDPLISTGFQTDPQFSVKQGTYKVSVNDANGCIASKNENVFLTDTMRLEMGNDTTVCSGSPVIFQPNTNQQTSVFTWQPSAGLNNAGIKNPVATPADTTKYYLTAQWGICQRTDSIIINILLKPSPNAGADTAVCLNTKAFLHGSSGRISGAINYLWEPSDFLDNINVANTIVSPNNAGTYLYTLTVSDNYGCNFSVKDEVAITMQPTVPASAGNDTAAVIGQPIRLHATGGVNYSWQPAVFFDDPFSANPLLTIENDSAKFTITVKDIAGCIGTDEILVLAYTAQIYFVPNAFSPNGDGRNDIFKPVAIGINSTDYFRVFNRYGQIIFETGGQLNGWDGTYKGKKQLPGTYVWSVRGKTFSGKTIEMKGTVILVR